MELETNLKRIASLAEEREDENWAFRSYLKMVEMKPEEMDELVRMHYEEVSAHIDCGECCNCCRVILPPLSTSEIERLATGMSLSVEEVKERYLVKAEEGKDYVFNEKPCPLLSENRCTAGDYRPDACLSFPNLHKDGFVFRLAQIVMNCSICPIVFNVYERLKEDLWEEDEPLLDADWLDPEDPGAFPGT